MSNIQCVRGTAKNFRSIGNSPVTINYEELGNLTLVHSELNGSGKSTLFVQLMIYALKGKAYNNKSKIGNLVNRRNNKKCVVEFEFKHGTDTYIVIRGQKPKIFELWKNGTLLDTAIDYQKQLNSIIGADVSFDMLVNTIILSSSRYTPFRLQTKKQREEFLDYIFRTHVYNPMVSESKRNHKELSAELSDIKIDSDMKTSQIDSKQSAINEFNRTKESISNDLSEQVTSMSVEMKVFEDKIATLDDNNSGIKDSIDDKQQILRSEQSKRRDVQMQINMALTEQKKKMEILSLDECDNCHQKVSEEIKSTIKREVAEKLEDIKPFKADLVKVDENIEAYNKELEDLNYEYRQYITERSLLSGELNQIKQQITVCYNQMKSQNNRFEDTIIEYEKDIKNLKKSLKLVSLKMDNKISEITICEEANMFLSNVNLRTEIMSKYVPHINKMLNVYLEEMEFFIEVTIDESYDVVVSSHSKGGLSIHDLSDGERSKIDLAFILVWKNIQDKITQDLINIFILDETLANFSPQSVKDFLKLVRKVLPDHKVIVILQHPNEFIETFDSIVEIKVENDFTYIDEVDVSINDAMVEDIFNIEK